MASTIDELRVEITAQTAGFNKEMAGVRSQLSSLDGQSAQTSAALAKLGAALKVALLGGLAAAAVGIGAAVKSAGNFQSSLSQLAQASGATGKQLDSMGNLARQLGKDTTLAGVTASDAAMAMVELSKAGLSVKDTMDATKGVLSLAKAGNIDFADAATIAASALNAFGMEGKDATKVADTLAAGANASQAQLADLALGMQQSATVAKQFGLSLNENVTALALFANNGIKGSDAGTSLKTMLIALAKPSEKAAEAMEEIGFNAYDASGKFVGLEEMSKRLKTATEGLTEEQKQNTLATIFGTDAFRAAAVLADNAGTSYEGMSQKVGQVGAAQAAAAAQMGPFQRATETLSNAFSDLGLTIGTYVLPHATAAINTFATFISTIVTGIPQAVSTFMTLLPVITGATVALGTYVIGANAAKVAVLALAAAQGVLNAVMRLNPFLLLASLAAGVVTAYFTLAGQTDSTTGAQDRLKAASDRLKVTTDALKDAQDRLAGAKLGVQGAALQVEGATNRYNEALKRNGRDSYEARSAAHDLAQAKLGLKRANDELAGATQNATNKDRENAAASSAFQAANGGKARSVEALTGSLRTQTQKMQDVNSWLNNLNGRKSTYTVEQWVKNITTHETRGGLNPPLKRYKGGPVRQGMPYLVGENSDGSLNRTTELFVPKSSGQIINSSDLRSMLGRGPSHAAGANTKDMQVSSMSHITVNIGEDTIIDTVVKGINNKSFMSNQTAISV